MDRKKILIMKEKTMINEMENKLQVVKHLEEMLENAKKGETVRFIGFLKTDDEVRQIVNSDFGSLVVMLLGLARTNWDFLEAAKMAVDAAENFRKDKARKDINKS